ncbi:hypothetical protein CVT25_002475 [Psilocybe cyanescens]|uniref:Protein kinase domain-containing protein n=1 Tax=Psilocybe cyanescens TaxID=93625 RepID=A0A409VUI9_PSICY|nr:hypothetical protein CVT25_002475 [Psilocybe cyanescens]
MSQEISHEQRRTIQVQEFQAVPEGKHYDASKSHEPERDSNQICGRLRQPNPDRYSRAHGRNVRVFIGSVEYERVVNKDLASLAKGSAIFYSNDKSDIPYLILTYDVGVVVEYRLVSLRDVNLPTQMFLRLAQAILAAHKHNIILGPELNMRNIEYDVSSSRSGLPCVAFKNLPPPTENAQPPSPPPKWHVPGICSLSDGSTKESDVYSGARVFFQMIEHVEKMVYKERPPNREGTHEFDYSSSLSKGDLPFPPNEVRIPLVVRNNKRLLRIVNKCLSPQPAHRPTASALCNMLLALCRATMIRRATLLIDIAALLKHKKSDGKLNVPRTEELD